MVESIESWVEEFVRFPPGAIMQTKDAKMVDKYPLAFLEYGRMIHRCYNKDYPGYENEGGRGIKVDESWLGPKGFRTFMKDMGPIPKKVV